MKLSFLIALIFSSLLIQAQKYYLFTGTYTTTGSKGIYVYSFDAKTGKTKLVSNTDSVVNPSYITLSANGRFVYAVNETNGNNPGKISAFSFNKKSGALAFINTEFSGGDDPCFLSVTKNNKWLAVANYTGGSVAVFPINKNGSLQPYSQLIQHTGNSINKERQEKAHVHESVFSPDEKYLLTPDLGMDEVMVYKFNPSSKKPLQPNKAPFIKITAGDGPRHIIFHPNKKFAYVINELSGSVIAFSYSDGKFTQLQELKTHPSNFKGIIGSAEIAVSKDGKFLYASNRGEENTITIFKINPHSGKLTLVGYQPVFGKGPRNFIIDANGNYLFVANQDSDNIVIFKRNKQTGLLKETGEQIKVSKPVCLQIMQE